MDGRGDRAPGTYAAGVSEPFTRELGTGDLEEFRRAGHALVDAVADYLAALPARPVWRSLPEDLRAELLSLPLPDGPTGLGPLAATMARDVMPHAMGNGRPAFFGWVNPPPSLAGVLASLTAAAMNPSVVSGDHADVHLERTAVRWLAELVGYPYGPGTGLLTSGASAATIVCLAGARGRAAAAAGRDVRRHGLAGGPPLLSYVPSETHSCVRRAIELLGLGGESIRPVPLSGGRLDPHALRAAIAADRAADGAGRAQGQLSSHAPTTWWRDSSCPQAEVSRARRHRRENGAVCPGRHLVRRPQHKSTRRGRFGRSAGSVRAQ